MQGGLGKVGIMKRGKILENFLKCPRITHRAGIKKVLWGAFIFRPLAGEAGRVARSLYEKERLYQISVSVGEK